MLYKLKNLIIGTPLPTYQISEKRLNKIRALAAFSPDAFSIDRLRQPGNIPGTGHCGKRWDDDGLADWISHDWFVGDCNDFLLSNHTGISFGWWLYLVAHDRKLEW